MFLIVFYDAYGLGRILPGGTTRKEAKRRAAKLWRLHPDYMAVWVTTAAELLSNQQREDWD